VGEPFSVMAAGCGGFIQPGLTAPFVCTATPVVAGLRYSERDRTVWLGFACDAHAEQLIAARALLPRDRDRLRTRQERERTELDGKRWAGLRDGPLARGRAADDLMTRARVWAAAHPWSSDPTA
jgi:hypothetical protein